MAKQFEHIIDVQGSHRFPIDMLRHDGLVPNTEPDSYIIVRSFERVRSFEHGSGQQVVQLRKWAEKSWEPTRGRWESFGWKVIGHGKTGREYR